jgi:hypothetical protein
MAKDPAFLFYPGDWLGGTTTMNRHLKGCYLDVLIAQFNIGPLSFDEIQEVLGADFEKFWPRLQKKFSINKDGLFFNERLELEKEKRQKYLLHQSENGKKGGRPKKPNETHGLSQTKPKQKHLENRNENRSINKEENENKKTRAKKNENRVLMPFAEKFKQAWQEWKNYKMQQHGFKYKSDGTEQAAINQLVNLSPDEETCIAIINQSMGMGWKGFFALKNNSQNGTANETRGQFSREGIQAELNERLKNRQ